MKHLHYGWVMLVTSVTVLAVNALKLYTFGVFIKPLTMEFNWDRGALSGAFSISMVVSGFIAILGGKLTDRYGPRIVVTIGGLLGGIGFLLISQVNSLWQVYLFWGLFMGISGGFCYLPIVSTIPRWFQKNRGLAVGITVTGMGLGGVISAPLAQWLISSHDWQYAFIILGIINFFIVIPLAQFMKHSPQRIGLRPYGEDGTTEDKQSSASTVEGLSFNQAIKTGRFWLFGLTIFCWIFAFQLIITHIVPYAIDIGISAMVAASILSAATAASIIGRNLTGFISDRIGGRLAQTISLILTMLALIWLLFAQETWMLYLFAVLFGIATGGSGPLETIVPAELFGLKFIGVLAGSIFLFAMVGGAIGPIFAGSIFDVTGSYSLAFLICVLIGALATILSLILLKAKGWHGGK